MAEEKKVAEEKKTEAPEPAPLTAAQILGGPEGAPAPGEAPPKIKQKKGRKNIQSGICHIQASFNNTIVTITDMMGATISWSSCGSRGFKGSRKSTPFAAQIAARDAALKAQEHGMRTVQVFIKGPGSGREAALRAVQGSGLKISIIRDVTPIPHNGCRPPKARRV